MEKEKLEEEYLVISWWRSESESNKTLPLVTPQVTIHQIKEKAGLEYAKRKKELERLYPHPIIKMARVLWVL